MAKSTQSVKSSEAKADMPSISDAEWAIMVEFWRLGPSRLREIVSVLEGKQRWKPRTVQTLINRLMAKGALAADKEGRDFIYRAAVDETQCVHEASRSFVDRVFGGRLAPLLATFLEREDCSREEIEELRRLLEQKEKP